MSKQGLFNYGQDIVMAFSPPVVGCLVAKGGSQAPQDPPGYALEYLIQSQALYAVLSHVKLLPQLTCMIY